MPSSLGGLGACPQKKNLFCAKNYAILSKFWYFFPILQHKNLPAHQRKWGIIPSPKSGGTYPPVPPPCSDAYGCFVGAAAGQVQASGLYSCFGRGRDVGCVGRGRTQFSGFRRQLRRRTRGRHAQRFVAMDIRRHRRTEDKTVRKLSVILLNSFHQRSPDHSSLQCLLPHVPVHRHHLNHIYHSIAFHARLKTDLFHISFPLESSGLLFKVILF